MDQGAEQLGVEELGGVDAVQGAEALRHHQAVRLQLLCLDIGLGQHSGQHYGVALQRLLNALGQQQQAHLVARIDPVAAIARLDQLLALQLGQQGIDQLRQLLLFVAQEQLCLEQRVDVDAAGDYLAAGDPLAAFDQGRHQGGQGEQVQYVVAVVGQQDRLIAVQADYLTELVLAHLELVELHGLIQQCLGILVRHGALGAVGHLLEQVQIGVDLGLQLVPGQGMALGGQQGQGAQGQAVDGGGIVDPGHQQLGQLVDGGGHPFGALLPANALLPVRHVLAEVAVEGQRLAEVDEAPAIVAQLAQYAEHLQEALFLLAAALELVVVGVDLHHVLVAQIDGHQGHRPVQPAHHGLQRHSQHPGLGRQQATGAGTATLGEELHRVALGEQQVQIFTEHCAVERVALEGAADEEGAAVAEDGARRPEVEVDAGRYVGRHHALVIDDVGEQQVVHVAAMAGDVDYLVPFLGQLAHLLGTVDREAAVELVPEPAEESLPEADQPEGEVGGDLVHVAMGALLRLLQANPLPPGLFFDGLLDHARLQQLLEQQVAVRQLGAGGRQLLATEVGAGHSRQLVGDGLVGAVLVRHVAQ
ncbi:hypothetical protein D3C78_610710 [compost metagenome]